jgi:NADPH:quinone reductase-like Zn-dependent oxidoreductase
MLAGLLPLIAPDGNVALCGNAGGMAFASTVMPFIIRGVSLLGIASAATARATREHIWQQLASVWKPLHLAQIATREVTLDELPDTFARMLSGASVGRTLVRIGAR